MKLKEAFDVIERFGAPVALSNELCSRYNHYDNSGILVENEGEITGVLFSLDFTPAAAEEAVRRGYNLIVTHHPAIYHGQKRITPSDDLISKALVTCIKNGVGVISMHLNFDSAEEGIDYYLMKGLGGSEAKIMDELSAGGYGRVYEIPEIKFGDFVKKIGRTFSTKRIFSYGDPARRIKKVASFCIFSYGDPARRIKKVASFCGAGADENAGGFAIYNCADVIVSSDFAHHMITGLYYNGVNVVQMTHYASEVYGFTRMAQKLIPELGVPAHVFIDEQLL